METKLFSIVLCLLVLEAAGSSLKNLTSIQHGTENASARSISTVGTESAQEMKVPSTQGMKRPSTQESTEGSLKGFPMQDYDRELYERIKGALSNQQPFSFLMMANSYGTRFDYPKAVSNALAKNPVDLDTNGIFPPDAKSNLVIVTNDVSAKIPTSAEEKLVSSMPEMTGYYDTQYIDTTTEKVSCPLIVVLGSTSDTCYTQGSCENSFLNAKNTYTTKWDCPSTIWMVYVHNVQNTKSWLGVKKAYGDNDIMTFAGTYEVPPKSKETKQPLKQTTQTTGSEEKISSPIQGTLPSQGTTGTGTDTDW